MKICSENYVKDINKPTLCRKKSPNCFDTQTGCVLRNTKELRKHLKFTTRKFHSAGCDSCHLWRSGRIAGAALIGAHINMHYCCYYYYYYYYYYYSRIFHFSASAGKNSPILRYVINRNRLDGLICSLKSFLQLNMFQELQIFGFVCTYWDAG
jgi:hypothetical protein